jgi:hypothetical protein
MSRPNSKVKRKFWEDVAELNQQNLVSNSFLNRCFNDRKHQNENLEFINKRPAAKRITQRHEEEIEETVLSIKEGLVMERARFFVIFIKKGVQEVEKITNFLKLKRYFA